MAEPSISSSRAFPPPAIPLCPTPHKPGLPRALYTLYTVPPPRFSLRQPAIKRSSPLPNSQGTVLRSADKLTHDS